MGGAGGFDGDGRSDRPGFRWDDDDNSPRVEERPGGRSGVALTGQRHGRRRRGLVAWVGASAVAATVGLLIGGSEPPADAGVGRAPAEVVPTAAPRPTSVPSGAARHHDDGRTAATAQPTSTDDHRKAPFAELSSVLPEAQGWDPLAALVSLPAIGVGESLAPTPYDRDLFGQRWLDVDRNGCDTRNDILRRDLDDLVVKEGTQGCVAYSGRFTDPYTAREFVFERGSANAGELHVDHVVALSDAWHKGAGNWTDERRAEFANDPMNLLVTFGEVNMAKGGRDAGSWVPPNELAGCGFAVHVVWIKERYGLAVSISESSTLGDLLATCEGSFQALVLTSESDSPISVHGD